MYALVAYRSSNKGDRYGDFSTQSRLAKFTAQTIPELHKHINTVAEIFAADMIDGSKQYSKWEITAYDFSCENNEKIVYFQMICDKLFDEATKSFYSAKVNEMKQAKEHAAKEERRKQYEALHKEFG